jgi:hypothetical protein
MIAPMQLAGIPIRDQDVLELARLLREADFVDVAEKLENAYDLETKVLALSIVDPRIDPAGARRRADGRARGAPCRAAS